MYKPLCIKDIQKYYECSKKTAIMRKKEIINYFMIRSNRINVFHISEYEGVPHDVVLDQISYLKGKKV